jgi:hypothetical protein
MSAGRGILGWYSEGDMGHEASITVHVAQIYLGVPRSYWWTPVPTVLITRCIAHEVAHHLFATRGYIFQRGEEYRKDVFEEAAANRYVFSVLQRMTKRWYYRMARWAIRDLGSTHFILGVRDWKMQKYELAAEHWSKARFLDPDNRDAAHWYQRASSMIEERPDIP